MPASQITSRSGSARAATSSGSSSRSAKNTERGLSSTAGTRSHHARSGERPAASVGDLERHGRSVAARIEPPVVTLELGRVRDAFLSILRLGERGRPEVLRRMRDGARAACPSCGAPNAPAVKFCGECGTALGARTRRAAAAAAARRARRRAAPRLGPLRRPRRLHDRVSEGRDAEEVRELLSRYFETARTVIERYGGTVEKFIGDAVMAVWGAPIAQEDDAERAVRAALELVAAVAALGTEVGAPELRARAGVLTGEAAVTLGAEGQGMVAGDLVNTASRIQSAAEPGHGARRRRDEARVGGRDRLRGRRARTTLKGKAEPVAALARARGSSASRRGALGRTGSSRRSSAATASCGSSRSSSTPPAEERRAQLVSVIGIGGIGKSRLSWEFEKYIDGLADDVWWHRGAASPTATASPTGRSPRWSAGAPGSSRTRRRRARREKLRAAVEEHVPDPRSAASSSRGSRTCSGSRRAPPATRRTSSPPGAHLLRAARRDRADGPRLRGHPVGRQRAARLHRVPARVVARPPALRAHARPARAPGPAADLGARQAQLHLDLPRAAVARGDGGAADRPRARAPRRAARADPRARRGRPALRGRDRPHAARPRPARARGQRVSADRRDRRRSRCPRRCTRSSPPGSTGSPRRSAACVQDACRAREGRSRCAGSRRCHGLDEAELEPLLAALVRKEVLSLQADPRSPERGQYGFLQDLVKKVAYETLSRQRAEGAAPRGGRVPRVARRRRRDRRGDRRALPRRLPRGTRRRRRRRDPRRGARDARPRRRARGVARRRRTRRSTPTSGRSS